MRTKTLVEALSATLVSGALVTGGVLYFFGAFKQWEGTYSGVIRYGNESASSPGLIEVMRKEGGAIVTFSMTGTGRCTIDFERDRMASRDGLVMGDLFREWKACTGSTTVYFGGGALSLDGDSIRMTLKTSRTKPMGYTDPEGAITLEFIGNRIAPSALSPGAPATSLIAPPAAPSGAKASVDPLFDCYSGCLVCGVPCELSADAVTRTECNAACFRSGAECCKKAGSSPSATGLCGCSNIDAHRRAVSYDGGSDAQVAAPTNGGGSSAGQCKSACMQCGLKCLGAPKSQGDETERILTCLDGCANVSQSCCLASGRQPNPLDCGCIEQGSAATPVPKSTPRSTATQPNWRPPPITNPFEDDP